MVSRWMKMPLAMVLMVTLSACGQATGNMGNMPGRETANTPAVAGATGEAVTAPPAMTMPGMDATAMPGMTETATADTGSMPGMDHSNMPGMSNAPYDAQFIDGMIDHHNGAIVMAQDALRQAEHDEIKQLAQTIIADQQKEVGQMQGWRTQWYPDLPNTGGMSMDMGPMTVAEGPEPYDQRFIKAMIAHHNGAIGMARDALTKAEHPEIKQLAEEIIKAQEAEIKQMQEWNQQWFGG